jgi:uncharacterized membrane protein
VMQNPAMWLAPALVTALIFVVAGWIPVINALVLPVLLPVFAASWLLAARKAAGGGTVDLNDAFSAFRSDRLPNLLVLGVLMLVASLALGFVLSLFGMGAVAGMMASAGVGSAAGALAAAGLGFAGMLVGLLGSFVIGMAFWFAPGLVALGGVAPVDAIKASLAASIKNIVPIIVFAVLFAVAAVIASIPLMLGWLVLLPLVLVAMYPSYRDIFGG